MGNVLETPRRNAVGSLREPLGNRIEVFVALVDVDVATSVPSSIWSMFAKL